MAKEIAKKKTTEKKKVAVEKTKSNNAKTSFSIINAIAIIAVLVILGFVGYLSSKNQTNGTQKQNVAAAQAISYNGEDGKNALELLKNKAEVQTQDSSIGTFVVGINGVSDSEDHFWLLYVNNELAQSTPDQLNTKNSDKLEWRFEQFKQ